MTESTKKEPDYLNALVTNVMEYVQVRLRLAAQREKQREAKSVETNAQFARTNEEFNEACVVAGIEPTARQASKYRREKGLAWVAARQARQTSERFTALAAKGGHNG